MSGVKKRPYRSPLRAGQAAASRRAVLASAQELFVRQGYGATTVEQIAAGAGVSKPTVFTAVGNKAAVLRAVRDVAMAGDDERRTVTQRASVSAIASAPDLGQAIRAAAAHISAVTERYHAIHEVLRGAAAADPEMADLWETAEQQRHTGAGHLVDRLATHAPLAVPRSRAVDRLWLLMAPDNYGRLVGARGWTPTAYRRWLRETIRDQLF
jgi:AcrR family transcriptional regulator